MMRTTGASVEDGMVCGDSRRVEGIRCVAGKTALEELAGAIKAAGNVNEQMAVVKR